MALDKKITTVFIITSVVVAGTALAAVLTTNTTTKTLFFGGTPVLAESSTTTTLTNANTATAVGNAIVDHVIAREAESLAAALLRILGLEVSIDEITSFKSRNIGNGELTLAYNLAHASGRSVYEILDMRFEQKMGWGKIAKTLGVKLHDAEDRSVLILHESQLDDDADKIKIFLKDDLDEEDKDNNPGNDNNNGHKNGNGNEHKPDKEDNNNNGHQGHGNGNGGNGHNGKH